MFIKLFGDNPKTQMMGIAAFVVVFSLLLVALVLVVAPIMGDKTSETKLSIEVVKVLIGTVGTAFGFLAGQMSSKSDKDKEDD